jgi:hypothetical protein
MANTSVSLVDLDFETIKTNLKNYLKRSDSPFKDVDFEGSNINQLLDVLSYNTYLNSYYLNMVGSEMFLDTAALRDSVVSHAKELNYVPRSARSSKCKIRVDFQASGDTQPYLIEKGSSFTSVVKNTSYIFTVPESTILSSANTTFSFETYVYEGIYLKESFIVDYNQENQRFIAANKNIDTDSLTVTVYEDASDVGESYSLTSSLLGLTNTSKVFFLQASDLGNYEVIFGDGIIGKKPKDRSTIIIDYRISNGSGANGAKEFSINFDPTSGDLLETPEVTVLEESIGGLEKESLNSVKYYAPRHFQIQERAITPSDYEIILKTQFPEINTISVYGGEEIDPPRFGKVFIAIDVSDVDGIPENRKNEYYSFIKRRSPLSIDPIIVEPIFTYIAVTSKVRYNVNISKATPDRLKSLVTQSINDYNAEYLNDFNSTLRYSKFNSSIDSSDTSIVSNLTELQIYKKIKPIIGVGQNFDINFNVPLINDLPELLEQHNASDRHTIGSSLFVYNGLDCLIEDNGSGVLRIVQPIGNVHKKVVDIGTVDYDKGIVKLINFTIDSYDGNDIKIYAKPRDNDITVGKNTILTIESSEIKIAVESVRV